VTQPKLVVDNTPATLGIDEHGGAVRIDIPRLAETRMLLTATSGGGKSWALRRILEQTHGRIQQIVIDPEDEFHTLREKYDYVLAGRHGGDCPADVRSAELLARKLLELGVSAIIGIYELQHHDRIRFVRLFLESLVNAPKDIWHPALVVVDEAHIFVPQSGEAESASAVIDLMSRGRKRGFAGLLATQRLSKLHKDAAAEAGNLMIGRSTLDVDVKRAVDSLGFSGREDQQRIRALKPGEFFCYGPALTQDVTLVRVGQVETTHPKAGQRAAAPVPPRERIAHVLGELKDLPAEAERKAKTEADLRAEVQQLNRELRAAKATTVVAPVAPSKEVIAQAREDGRIEERGKWVKTNMALMSRIENLMHSTSQRIATVIAEELEKFRAEEKQRDAAPPAEPRTYAFDEDLRQRIERAKQLPAPKPVVRQNRTTENSGLSGPEQRILDAIAWLESIGIEAPEQTAVAFLAGYTYGGGAFNNPRGALRTKGLVEYAGDGIRLTDLGRDSANFPDAALTADELQRRVLDRLPGPEQRILKVILDEYPRSLTNEECARRASYAPNAGAYNNPRGRLRSLGLIEYPQPGHVKARALLFLE